MKEYYHRRHCILSTICTITAICGFSLFMLYVLLLSVNNQFIAYNQFSNTGKYPAVLFYVAIAFCIIYALLLMISLFGIWATLKQSTYILKLYMSILFVIVLLQLAAGILSIVYMKTMPVKLQEYMADNLRSNYTGGFIEYQFDKSVDWVQSNYECCGVVNERDYRNGYYYNTNNKYSTNILVPASCCVYRNQLNLLNQCQTNLVNAYRKGCYDILMIWLDRYGSIIGSIAIIMAFVHLVCFVFTFKMCRLMDKERKRNIKNRQRDYHVYDTSTLAERLSTFEM